MNSTLNPTRNEASRVDALIRQLYQLKEERAEALYQPDPEYLEHLDERAEALRCAIEEAGGVIPDALL
ncbi:MAG: hypothetical protein LBS49_03890 [Candidatus Accumulibacter sp.]|jgi:hypothetical protein|nr:hypothetical protein [Accumulibacter sp.]